VCNAGRKASRRGQALGGGGPPACFAQALAGCVQRLDQAIELQCACLLERWQILGLVVLQSVFETSDPARPGEDNPAEPQG